MRSSTTTRITTAMTAALFACGLFLAGPSAATDPAKPAAAKPAAPTSVKVGEAVGEFKLNSADGSSVSHKDIAGKPTVMIFFQTACSICTSEVQDVRSIRETVDGLNVVLVSIDMRKPADNYEGYRKNYAGDLPIWLDSKFSLPRRFGVSATPALVMIDSKGILKEVKIGYHGSDKPGLEKRIRDLQ